MVNPIAEDLTTKQGARTNNPSFWGRRGSGERNFFIQPSESAFTTQTRRVEGGATQANPPGV